MEKICLIYQPVGKGDALFLQKFAHYYINLGYRIIWPVVHEYSYLNDYIPEIEWISWDDKEHKLTHKDKLPDHVQFPYKEKYDPYSNHIFTDEFVFFNGFLHPGGRNVMDFKYENIGMEFSDWADYIKFKRNKEKEDELYYNILGLKDDEDYVFVNRNYQMRPQIECCHQISTDPNFYGKKVVELQILEGFSAFDWCKVIEEASSIYMIETSINYILESPQMRDNITPDRHLFHRFGNYSEVLQLFKLKWHHHM